jgi:hypothetical protein
MSAAFVPWFHRRRWPNNELCIRELVKGANLNENYGYTYDQVPNRTRQRRWEKAQAKVEVTQNKLAQQREAIKNQRQQLSQLQQTYAQQRIDLEARIVKQRRDLCQRQRSGKPSKRSYSSLRRLKQELTDVTICFLKRQRCLIQRLHQHQTQSSQLQQQLGERIAARNAIDTETLCRERHLEKDQVMLNLQVLLGNLHDWVRKHYFAPDWRSLTLEKATQMIYRKSGRVTWHPDRIEVVLDPYSYRDWKPLVDASTRLTCAGGTAARYTSQCSRIQNSNYVVFNVLFKGNASGSLDLSIAISRSWCVALVVLDDEYRHLNHPVRDVGGGFVHGVPLACHPT